MALAGPVVIEPPPQPVRPVPRPAKKKFFRAKLSSRFLTARPDRRRMVTRSQTAALLQKRVVAEDELDANWLAELSRNSNELRLLAEQASESNIELREQQLKLMTAARPDRDAEHVPWPDPSPAAIEAFTTIHELARKASPGYLATQRRMLFLWDVGEELRPRRFDYECFVRRLAPTTAETYWTAWITLSKAMGAGPALQSTKLFTTLLGKRAHVFPVRFPKPMTKAQVLQLQEVFSNKARFLTAVITACWRLGQRIGDFVQIATKNIRSSNLGNVAIYMTSGKMISQGHVPPYYLYLPRFDQCTTGLLLAQADAQARGWPFLLSGSNTPQDIALVESQIRSMLHEIDPELELRSIRRGGLQHMASREGVTLDQALLHSKHKNVNMLRRYLDHGFHSRAEEEVMLNVMMAM